MLHVDELERGDLPEFAQATDHLDDIDAMDAADTGDAMDAVDTGDAMDAMDAMDGAFDEVTEDGVVLPDEVQAELEALAAAELEGGDAMEQALAEAQREIARQRSLTRQAVARYRDALLAAEPELPPDLVQGETLEDVDATAQAARATVARIRERVAAERPRGFPVGAPARVAERPRHLSPHEKIAAGLQERLLI